MPCWLTRSVIFCDDGGIPVTASSFDFSWPMVQEGVIRRSDEELSEVMRRGISPAVCIVTAAILWESGR